MDIAVSRPFSKDKTDFFQAVAFGQKADFVHKYFTKGQPILIHGHLINNNYDSRSGTKYRTHQVIVDDIEFAGYPKGDTRDKSEPVATTDPSTATRDSMLTDLMGFDDVGDVLEF